MTIDPIAACENAAQYLAILAQDIRDGKINDAHAVAMATRDGLLKVVREAEENNSRSPIDKESEVC